MPRRHRYATGEIPFHLLNRSAKRLTLFDDPDEYAAFVQVLKQAVERQHASLFAYCVMPNHWHLVAAAYGCNGIARFMHWLTMTHALRWRAARGRQGEGAVYQGRYKAIPVGDTRHFLQVCRYVERNALRAGLVGRAEEWKWGSLFGEGRSHDWIAPWPCIRPENWIELVNRPQTATELDWARKMPGRVGKDERARPRGRPRKPRDE